LDSNKNGLRDVGEYGQAGWSVSLVDNSGQPLQLRKQIEPNTMDIGPVGSSAINGVVLGTVGSVTDGRVGVMVDPDLASNKIFSGYSNASQSFISSFNSTGRQFQATFVADTTTVSIDAIGSSSSSYGRLEAYNSAGQLLGRYTTKELSPGQTETMTISRGVADISYVLAFGTARTSVKLDNLRYGAESTVQTGVRGDYYFPAVPEGTYNVKVAQVAGLAALSPVDGQSSAVVTANNATTDIDFGFVQSGSSWQNPRDPLDVDNNTLITPVDALFVINALNTGGRGELAGSGVPTFPYVDVNGDGVLSPVDALLIINHLNQQRGGGEGERSENGFNHPATVCVPLTQPLMSPLVGEGEDDERTEDDELLLLLSLDRIRNSLEVQ
jgi:hypothetical protein